MENFGGALQPPFFYAMQFLCFLCLVGRLHLSWRGFPCAAAYSSSLDIFLYMRKCTEAESCGIKTNTPKMDLSDKIIKWKMARG